MPKDIVKLAVEGMSCNHCVNSIKKAVGNLDGVDNVEIDLEGKKVTVEYDSSKVKVETIKDSIEDQGYDVV
ncbi:copper chaperone CopZ [Acetivibrio mesophilus]|uniref:Copper chaperone CopZ n=1 Tax=Acetivibrio mesophilus TaxID=2487273 RepID=A0A4Q0I5X9_9FIRM|nr:copper chaperone CopZ [Acetivibrio mesophilus]ODM25418.1 copper resistance protein CopZ [Clostridium sp. Bc-iso-3]RXE58352.1 copper resistance protein CopZ [Acetivibrio mesophilus]HHV28910.1 copper chaperone CopZ [Clostridium sp.]